MKNAAKFVGGSVLVYALVAACAAEEREASRRAAEGGRDAAASSSGEAASSSSGNGPSLLDPVAEALAEDGSRLRARFLRAGDGARQWAGRWLDTERGEDCHFLRGEDGKERCLPFGAHPIGRVRSGTFADSACTVPVYRHDRTLCPPAYVLFNEPEEACQGGAVATTNYAVAKVGQLHGGEVYELGAGCSSAGFTTPAHQYYELELVPASAFVAAEVE